MINETQLDDVEGTTVVDATGDKIGKAGQVYLDDETGQAEWVTVHTGLFGSSESFVPLREASLAGKELRVPFEKARVKDAPRVSADGHLEPSEEDELYRYYGMSGDSQSSYGQGTQSGTQTGTAGMAGTAAGVGTETSGRHSSGEHDARGTVGHDTSGPSTDDAMTRSEESLRVGTQTREAGRARLRKRVVTERQTVTVPVSHEEVTVTSEPITESNRGAAYDGPAISEEEHEVVLHEEVPVVSKEVHAVERVRLGTETVTEDRQVTEDVRKEQIEVEDDGTKGGIRR